MSEQDIPDIHLRVLYDFEYIAKGNRKITIQEGEKLFLIKKTNSDWWQVIRSSSERPFYVPAAYVEEYSRSPESRKEISRCRSFKKIEERKLKSSAPLPVIKRSIPSSSSYEEEVVCDKVENMGERKRSCSTEKERFNSEKQKTSKGESSEHSKQFEKGNKENISTSNKEQVNHILLDKRKSWAVEELVAELSKMRSERNSPCHQEQNAQHITKENVISLGPYVVDNSDRLSPDSITCSSKYTLSLERDKTDSETEGNTQYKEQSQEKTGSIGETYSKVCLNPPKASKNVDKASRKLSDSLERLAQQIQFEPSETSSSRSTPGKLSHSLDESKISPFTNTSGDSGTKMESMFSRMRNKLSYSSSFKTKKEMQQGLKRGGGNSVLSTSWENALSETEFKKTKDERRSLEEKRSFRTSAKVMLDPIKGEARFLDGQLKTSRSGSELDGLGQENASQKAMQSWNLVQQKVFGDKLKSVCVSGSESEENLDESIGQDEDSVSGVSDDILMFQNATKVSYSDFSDGAMSDDLLVEPLEDRKEKDIHGKLQKRKVSLTRRNRVESYGSRNYTSPPSPSPGDKPVRVLNEDWEEYKTSHGRTYYYNHRTRDKSWKPPRRQHKLSTEDGSIENLRSSSSSPLVEVNGSSGSNYIPVPDGWRESYDGDSGQPCYINDATGAKWFSSNDSEGRVYFFEENSNESSWTLPKLSITTCESPSHPPKQSPSEQKMGAKEPAADEQKFEGDVQLRSDQQELETENKTQYRMAKAHSMVLVDSRGKTSVKSSSIPRNWPQLWDGDMCVLKEGTLNRTKITENGKKLRKNWAPAHVVLTELFLLFFKDAKTFAAMKNSQGEGSSGAARPEFCVDLNGALLEHGEKASSRRNVFLVSTVLGLQVLIQCESATQEEEWYQAIHKAITDLPSAYDSCPRHKAAKLSPQLLSSSSPEETKKSYRIGRSRSVKSVKLTLKDGSQEDLTVSPDENQTKIRNRLKKFFHRRPTKESLVKKGIYKDEPVFGCHLPDVCKGETPRVPAFVQRCVAAIECKEENMKTDGLYRASGNLSQVQKIRLQVDQNNLATLEQEEDVHVLTGALKLFFRELKQPLIPYEHFNKALKASTNPNKKEKLQHFRDIVKALSHPNRDTLEFLLKHLLRVTEYQEFNRMHIPNLAIVFGPTLMWPEAESLNMALDLMQQNLVIECFLQDFSSIFR